MQNFNKKLSLVLCLLIAFSCTKEESTPKFDLNLSDSSLGKILTDADGKTLYFFSNDIAGNSQCTGGCLTNWPIFNKANATFSADLTSSDFATITRADGATQTTYKGWPLYYFASDAVKGDVKGENVGKIWFAAKPTYSLFVGNIQLVGKDGKNYLVDYTEGTGKTKYLMDNQGRTLYGFKNDTKNTNKYTKSDFSNEPTWPIAQITDLTNLPSGFAATDFTIIDVFGKKQLSYKGHPLYYYGPDGTTKGATLGVSVPKPGIWPIVNSDTLPLE